MLVGDFLAGSARALPDKVCLVFGRQRLTYAEVDAAANRLANYLIGRGVGRGDRVCIFMDNSPALVTAIFGALKAGAVFSVLNAGTKADRLAYILNHCRATALVSHRRKGEVLAGALGAVPSLRAVLLAGEGVGGPVSAPSLASLDEALAAQSAAAPPRLGIDQDLASLIYTSGSTGQPKGVMSTHLGVVAAARSIAEYLENDAADVVLDVLPLSSSYGLYQLLVTFMVGATLVLEEGFVFPYRVLQLLREHEVTGMAGVPTIFARLLQLRGLTSDECPRLRYLTNAAAAISVSHLRRLRAALPRTRIYSMYGQTECTRVCYLPPEEIERRPDSVGRAIPNTEVYIVDEAGRRVGPGEVGELVVRGSHVMRGYWESPEETARALRPGPVPGERVLYTGDLFRMDEAGSLYFVSRRDDIIKCRGEKVSPREVEDALYGLDGVVEAAIVGAPDEVLGEAIVAFVALREGAGLAEREILAHCARALPGFMVPERVEILASLPKIASGKISKRELREKVLCAASSGL